MVLEQATGLPRWLVDNFLISSTGSVDTRKLVFRMALVIGFTILSTISLFSRDTDVRKVVSVGFEHFGKISHELGNTLDIILALQYLACQVVNYRTYRSLNRVTRKLLRPLVMSPHSDWWEKVLLNLDRLSRVFTCSLSVLATYSEYGFDWWLLAYKFLLALYWAHVNLLSVKLLITDGLFLHHCCKMLSKDVTNFKALLTKRLLARKKLDANLVARRFQAICAKINFHDRYWSKVISLVTSTTFLITACAIFVCVKMDNKVIGFIGLIFAGLLFLAASALILTPSKLASSFKKGYPLVSKLMLTQRMTCSEELKLLRLVEQYDDEISFSAWNMGKLEYMDFVQVSRCDEYSSNKVLTV